MTEEIRQIVGMVIKNTQGKDIFRQVFLVQSTTVHPIQEVKITEITIIKDIQSHQHKLQVPHTQGEIIETTTKDTQCQDLHRVPLTQEEVEVEIDMIVKDIQAQDTQGYQKVKTINREDNT